MLVAAWGGWAWWQYHEYGHAREAARQTVRRQAHTVMTALVGGIRFHRRFGPAFPEQLQAQLDALAEADDVLAVAVGTRDGKTVFSAGRRTFQVVPSEACLGESWEAGALRYGVEFPLEQQPEVVGGGWGGGRGMGRGRRAAIEPGPFGPETRLVAMLLVDGSQADAAIGREARLRVLVVAAGGLVLVFLAAAWWASLRLAAARGRAAVLEAEARHLRDLSQAAAGLAHETRNPLGLIRGWTQRLAESDPSPDRAQRFGALIEECDRITARINHFLAFARPASPALGPVDLDRLFDDLAAVLEPDLDAKGVTLDRPRPVQPCSVEADAELLRQALFNLVGNAIGFSPPRGVVEIAVRGVRGGTCRIEVADRGPGVAAEHVPRLFSPYFTTRPGGTGLGLAMVRRIAAAHGWTAGHSPRAGGGAVFWIDAMRVLRRS